MLMDMKKNGVGIDSNTERHVSYFQVDVTGDETLETPFETWEMKTG